MDDVVHLWKLTGAKAGDTSDDGLGECGRRGVVTLNHKRVTCDDCIDADDWHELHETRWGGKPCSCAAPSGGG